MVPFFLCRNETSADLVPMCKAEYIAWFTEQCPPYCRLSKVSAEQKWSKDFLDQRVQRDQVMCNDLDGNSMGWVACLTACLCMREPEFTWRRIKPRLGDCGSRRWARPAKGSKISYMRTAFAGHLVLAMSILHALLCVACSFAPGPQCQERRFA